MKIIITMSGHSQRFTDEGYDEKPFIHVLGKTIIHHIVSMFPNREEDIIFLIREHDDQARMRLERLFPKARVAKTPANNDGPVVSILNADLPIDANENVVVNYCDLLVRWDFEKFLTYCRMGQLDGCLVTHTGWHPHRLYNKSFCFLRNDDDEVLEVREKQPFTDNIFEEHASNGTYYFARYDEMIRYFRETIRGARVNGEYYVTMPYNHMIRDDLKVGLYETDHYICFGTPRDIRLLQAWETILTEAGIDSSADAVTAFRYWRRYLRDQ